MLHFSFDEWLNLRCRGNQDLSAVHFAAFNGNLELLRELVIFGADIHSCNHLGMNALHMAAQGDQPSIIYYLT